MDESKAATVCVIFRSFIRPYASANAQQGFRRSYPQKHSNLLDKFSWVQNPVRVEDVFEFAMELADHPAGRVRPPALFGQTNTVFAGDNTAPGQHLRE